MIGSFFRTATTTAFLFVTGFYHAAASDLDVNQKLIGFDAYMAKGLVGLERSRHRGRYRG
jgi:hypothetical protein